MQNILHFHTTIWCNFFSDLLYEYQNKYNCNVAIVCSDNEKNIYRKNFSSGAEHFLIPDFTRTPDWEDNKEEVRQLEKIVHECEKAAGLSVGRIILTGERGIGKAYSAGFYYWPKNALQKKCLKDNSYPVRIILRYFHFLNNLFTRFNPDLILARGISESLSLCAWFLSKREDIPFFSCRFSKVISKRAFWTDDFNMYNTLAKEKFQEKLNAAENVSSFADGYVQSFRGKPKTVDYIAQNWKNVYNYFSIHRNFLALIKVKLFYYLSGAKGKRPKSVIPKVTEYYRNQFMKFYHKKYFREFLSEELKGFKYIYYPLHKEPELMLNFEAPLWHDQKHAIKHISSMLPSGYKLLVKEHRFNWGRRHTNYLEYMARLPGVVLIDPFNPQFKYIENADLIMTDNGSTGWEGLLLQKPVVILEKTFYDAAGLARRVIDPTALDGRILEALNHPMPYPPKEYDKRLGLVVDAEFETTLDIEEMHGNPLLSMEYIERLLKKQKPQ